MNKDSGNIIVYNSDGTKIEVRLENENVWLTQAQLAELYQSSKSNVSVTSNIFEEGELSEDGCSNGTTQPVLLGKTQEKLTNFYNLDISFLATEKSRIATKFRIWATERLKGTLSRFYNG